MSVAVKMTKVNSSNIAAIGYNEVKQTLVVLFHSGTTYTYTPVLKETYEEFLKAESIGKYFYSNIKTNPKIKCQQI